MVNPKCIIIPERKQNSKTGEYVPKGYRNQLEWAPIGQIRSNMSNKINNGRD